uniref:Uncharacterized protein n=1 Tax=Globodera rostochiensis TaxID=31243 RepID=A0A914I973_GLORO
MVNFPSISYDDYIGEQCLGENLQPGLFYDENTKFCLISATDVLLFDSDTGQRLDFLRHSDNVIGMHFYEDMLVSITDLPEIYAWEVKSKVLKLRRKVNVPVGYQIVWSYELDKDIYLLAMSCGVVEESSQDSVLLKFALHDLFNDNNEQFDAPIDLSCVVYTGERPLSRRHFDVGNGFCVKCQGKRVKMITFDDASDEGIPDSGVGINGTKAYEVSEEFVLKSHFQVEDQCLVEFDSVKIAGESLFATVNIGRIYSWTEFRNSGLSAVNSSHVTLTGHRVVMEVTAQGTMFVGTGNGLMLKYNIAGSSGVGRWHKLEQLSLDSPARSMVLSADFATLAVVLSDNSVCIVRSSGLCLTVKAEVVKRPIANSIGIMPDPVNSRRIFTNSRVGCVQWIDPLLWKTTNEADISEENVPPEDTFNRPEFLCIDVYLVCLSIPRIATCECRKNDLEKTYLKFWRRSSADRGEERLEMENCVVVPRRILFVRSTLDEFWDRSAVTVAMANGQEFLVICLNGEMDVYIRDENRDCIWRRDPKRHEQNWQQFTLKYCSSIRNQQFATVNSFADNSNIFVWSLITLSIVKLIDKLRMVEQVEWSSQKSSVLIIACQSGIVSYDSNVGIFIWAIRQPGMSISSNHLTTFAYDKHFVYALNASNGTLASDPLHFDKRQKKIVAVGDKGNVWFVGITEEGSLSVLKPDLPQNKLAHSVDCHKPKSTAFSQLLGLNGEAPRKNRGDNDGLINGRNSIMLLEMPSIKQFVDGPAHSLPPITQLARQFVQACLAKKSII